MSLFRTRQSAVSLPQRSRGFTLLELIIVIAILAILAVIITLALNPAETLARARDSQRLSDLNSLRSAIGLYLTEGQTNMDNQTGNVNCADAATTSRRIWYSLISTTDINDASLPTTIGADTNAAGNWYSGGVADALWALQVATPVNVNGTGWVPLNFTTLPGGPVLPALPVDPRNAVANGTSTLTAVTNQALVYRYSCTETVQSGVGTVQVGAPAYEVNAALESDRFTTGTDEKIASDGGDNVRLYETGNSLRILPTSDDF